MRSADYSPMLTFDSGTHQAKAFRRAVSGRAGVDWIVDGVTAGVATHSEGPSPFKRRGDLTRASDTSLTNLSGVDRCVLAVFPGDIDKVFSVPYPNALDPPIDLDPTLVRKAHIASQRGSDTQPFCCKACLRRGPIIPATLAGLVVGRIDRVVNSRGTKSHIFRLAPRSIACRTKVLNARLRDRDSGKLMG